MKVPTQLTFTAKRFKALSADLYQAADYNDSRPILNNVLVAMTEEGGTVWYRTDSYVLYRIELNGFEVERTEDLEEFGSPSSVQGAQCFWQLNAKQLYDFGRSLKVADPQVQMEWDPDNNGFVTLRCGATEMRIENRHTTDAYPSMAQFLDEFDEVSEERRHTATQQLRVGIAPRYMKRIGSLKLNNTDAPVRLIGHPKKGDRQSKWETKPTYFRVVCQDVADISIIVMPVRIEE